MLEEYVDKASNGIKAGIGWVRDHKNKLIAGALVGVGAAAGIGVVTAVKSRTDDECYCMIEAPDVEITDVEITSDDQDSILEVTANVTLDSEEN